LQLPQIAQEFIGDGKLSMGHGRALLGLKKKEKLTSLIQKVINERLSVRQLEEMVQQMNKDVPRETKEKKNLSPFLRERESNLKNFFGTNVQIKKGKKKGKIEIEFFSDEDLERILELLEKEED
jgi:ParB family chromosome partitioning protein